MSKLHRTKVWDPVTRIWHWALALSVVVGWCIGEFRSFSTIQWHFYFGYAIGVLIVFRVGWGFVGPAPIRHRTLLAGLRDTPGYLRRLPIREPSGTPGHNPLGSVSVIALILALAIQVASGLFSEDDGLFSGGPLSGEVPGAMVRQMTEIHNIGAKVILTLVVLHLCAIAFYWIYKKENLVSAMITGWKWTRK